MARRSDSKLVSLRKMAQKWAKERKETLTTVHLLAAICEADGPAQALLAARRLDSAAILKAARIADEGVDGAIKAAFKTAHELVRRAPVPTHTAYSAMRGSRPGALQEPDALNVLVALLSNRHYAAYRALDQHGVDIARLRNAARSIALGLVAPPRRSSRAEAKPQARVQPRGESPAPEPRQRPRRTGKAIPVPLIPPLDRAPARHRGANVAPLPPSQRNVGRPVSKAGPGAQPGHSDVEATPPSGPRPSQPQTAKAKAANAAARSRGSRPPASPDEDVAAANASAEVGGTLLSLDDERLSTLAKAGVNLTVAAARGELEPVLGRDAEIEQVLDILARRSANSALLVGPPGVGKSSIIRGIAQRFANDARNPRLLVEITVAELLSVTSGDGRMSIAERMANICREVALSQGAVVLVIDNLHELLSNNLADEAVLELKLALSRGGLPLIAVATRREHQQMIAGDPVLSRRMSVLEVEPPDEADAFVWLRAVTTALAAHHQVAYEDEAIAAAVSWSIRYMPSRALPDKALSLLDLAGARTARRAEPDARVVGREQVARLLAEAADVPLERLLESDHERMLRLATLLGSRVVGHQAACERIAAVLRRNAAGLRGDRPIGTLLLLGPTGVGKTETAKAIAELLFDSRDAMTRLDMSEYSEPHAVARLIGAPPGYVGHEAGGALTEALRRRPYQVVLLDEIEKAHRDVLQTFLQVFDEGRLTDGRGKTVDFRQSVIVLTSNIGAAEMGDAMRRREVGFGRKPTNQTKGLESVAISAAKRGLAPELYNRIDEVIFFKPLERVDVRLIAQRLLTEVGDKLASREIQLQVDDAVFEALLDQGGYDAEFGARPMRRAVARLIEAPIADMILAGELVAGTTVLISVADGSIAMDTVPAHPARRTA